MKYLKRFENINEPEVGDYVICFDSVNGKIGELNIFLSNNIGIFIDTEYTVKGYPYLVKFKNIPNNLGMYTEDDSCMMFMKDEIVHFSKNKKDLDIYIDQNKYNL